MRPEGWHPAWWWLLVIAVCAMLAVTALRGYLSPAAVIDLSNSRLCESAAPGNPAA
ncbi:MAG TPA: hypothetical protein VNM24_06270 [Burkholderiales bacterium]|jgi:hypothetical protein|nr:hypothetical protein [Burkholderiales bacterium]